MISVRWRVRTLMGLVLIAALSVKCVLFLRSKHVERSRRQAFLAQFSPLNLRPRLPEPVLVAALDDADPGVRHSSLWALDSLGSTSPALIPILVGQLESETEKLRWRNRRNPQQVDAARALKRIRPPAAVIAPLLRKAMASQEPWVRLQAADVLCDAAKRPGPPAPALAELLLAALKDREALIRTRAPEALARLDDNTRRKAVDILLGQLREPDRPGQLLAAIGLSRFGQEAQASVTILTDRLRGGDVASRLSDLYLLGRIGPAAMRSVPAVVREMTSPDAEGHIWSFVNQFMPSRKAWHWMELEGLLDSSGGIQRSFELCALGAFVLGRIGPEAERQAVDLLVGMVRGDDESLRTRATDALGALGPRASAAIPTLLDLAERRAPVRPGDSDYHAEFRLTKALERVCTGGDPRFIAASIRMLKSSEPAKRWGAATTLSHLKPPAPDAVPMLIEALKDETQAVRFSAAVALGRYEGPEREAALPALLDALRDEDEWVRCMAAQSLACYRAGAQQAVRTIVKSLGSEEPNLRREAAEVLGEFGPEASSAVPALRKARHDAKEFVRDAAAKALKAIAPPETANPVVRPGR